MRIALIARAALTVRCPDESIVRSEQFPEISRGQKLALTPPDREQALFGPTADIGPVDGILGTKDQSVLVVYAHRDESAVSIGHIEQLAGRRQERLFPIDAGRGGECDRD